MNSFFLAMAFLPIADRYPNRELEEALSVDSVNPPLLVMRPLNIEGEYVGESKNGCRDANTKSAFLHGK